MGYLAKLTGKTLCFTTVYCLYLLELLGPDNWRSMLLWNAVNYVPANMVNYARRLRDLHQHHLMSHIALY